MNMDYCIEDLQLERNDVEHIFNYVKNSKDNFGLKVEGISFLEELCDLLVKERINYRYIASKKLLKFNECDEDINTFIINFIDTDHLSRLRIKNITMRYLFGYIKYDLDVEDGLLVVHAPNGYGKSTLIKCIKYFSFGDLINLFNLPFYEFTIQIQDDLKIKGICSYSFINDNDKHYLYSNSNDIRFFIEFNPHLFINNEDYIESRKIYSFLNALTIIHNYNEEERLEIEVSNGKYNIENKIIESIALFNKYIQEYFGEEKIIYLDNKYIYKDNNTYFDLINALVIKNNIEPLKCVNGIFKYNEIISFDQLSDGEKYVIYFLFKFIFNGLVDKYLYIIDEPELNLHIEWQQLLIKHIKELIEESNEYIYGLGNERHAYLLFTHSPYIVNYPDTKVGNPEYETE